MLYAPCVSPVFSDLGYTENTAKTYEFTIHEVTYNNYHTLVNATGMPVFVVLQTSCQVMQKSTVF